MQVLKKHKASPLECEGTVLDVTHLQTAHKPTSFAADVVQQPNVLLIQVTTVCICSTFVHLYLNLSCSGQYMCSVNFQDLIVIIIFLST